MPFAWDILEERKPGNEQFSFSEHLRFRLFCLFERDLNKYKIQISNYCGIYGLKYTHGKWQERSN